MTERPVFNESRLAPSRRASGFAIGSTASRLFLAEGSATACHRSRLQTGVDHFFAGSPGLRALGMGFGR